MRGIQIWTIAFLVTLSPSAMATNSFDRSCTYDGNCNFNNGRASDTVFLPCESGKCVCREPEYKMMDVAFYSVSDVAGDCVVEGSAPCGTSNGLTLKCQSGRTCVEGRCRSTAEIRSTPLNYACSENIDCQEGLICKGRVGSFPPMSYCSRP